MKIIGCGVSLPNPSDSLFIDSYLPRSLILFDLSKTLCELTGARSCRLGKVIQSLWSDYGVIQRVELELPNHPTAIVKHIDLSEARPNRRGWSGDVSHQRKVQSYKIEKNFYQTFAAQCFDDRFDAKLHCRVPRLLASLEKPESSGWLLVMEDLDDAGFVLRSGSRARDPQANIEGCLRWLANFHATFMGCKPDGLWPVGTYWHLATRREEWNAMDDGELKRLASAIDQRLNAAKFQTFVHGDAKLANFCFSVETKGGAGAIDVAAVDFQYVGGGCGMKDVAYLVSSCLDGSESQSQQDDLLDIYFQQLKSSLAMLHPEMSFAAIESEWRELYAFAWADFCRFLAGWSPGHWKLNEYNDRVTRGVLSRLSDEGC